MSNVEENQHLRDLLRVLQNRQRVLEIQAATQGNQTPPHIIIEIGDLRTEIDRVKAELSLATPIAARTDLRRLRQQALKMYYAPRWTQAEVLLAQVMALDHNDNEVGGMLKEVQQHLDIQAFYQAIRELKEEGRPEAVLNALDDLAKKHPEFSDPDGLRQWAKEHRAAHLPVLPGEVGMTNTHYGRYQIKEKLGQGGASIVFLAHDPATGRDVALKVLAPSFLQNAHYKSGFQKEIKIISQLEHYAIVRVYDCGEEDFQPYIVMQYMKGKSLENRLNEDVLSLDEIVSILRRICSALRETHSRNVIHRDIKPGNVLFDKDKNAYLADFGISRLTQGKQTANNFGTPQYMAPEQILGQDIDNRTDIYQVGAMLFEMLTGHPPYESDNTATLFHHHINSPIPQLRVFNPEIPLVVQDIINKSMAKKKEERFANISAFYMALRSAMGTNDAFSITDKDRISSFSSNHSRKISRINSITQQMTLSVLQMDDIKMTILTVSLITCLTIMTLLFSRYIEQSSPFIWDLFGSFYFIAAPLAYTISQRSLSPLLVHVPIHIIINVIILKNYLSVYSVVVIIIGGLISGIVLYLLLNQTKISNIIRFPLSLSLAYISMFIIAGILPIAEHLEYYTIIGAVIVGFASYIINEIYDGVKKGRDIFFIK